MATSIQHDTPIHPDAVAHELIAKFLNISEELRHTWEHWTVNGLPYFTADQHVAIWEALGRIGTVAADLDAELAG